MSGIWFRAYCDALDNPKLQLLEPELFKAWFNLMCLAKMGNGRIPSMSLVAFRLRVDGNTAKRYLDELSSPEIRLLEKQDDGSWTPHDWAIWQYPSDTSALRTKQYRERKKQDVTSHVTGCDGEGDGLEKSREEKSREEKKEHTPAADAGGDGGQNPPPIPPRKKRKSDSVSASTKEWFFKSFWPVWPVKENRESALCMADGIPESDRAAAVAGAIAHSEKIRAMDRPIHASTWLNQRRWEDQIVELKPKARDSPMLFPIRETPTERAIRIGHERILEHGRL